MAAPRIPNLPRSEAAISERGRCDCANSILSPPVWQVPKSPPLCPPER